MTKGRKATEQKRVGTGTRGGAGETKRAVSGKKKASKRGTGGPTKAENSESGTCKEKRLGEEAHNVMGSRTSTIVEHLIGRTRAGDKKSAEMLKDLAEKEAEAKEALEHGPLRSQALAWEAEPQWQDPVDPENAETDCGSREAE